MTPALSLVGVADPNPTRRHLLASLTGAAPFDDAIVLLAGVPLDGLVVASPASDHLGAAGAAAAAGVPVLVEKPPAPDAIAAADLAALRPTPWVGFNRRFDPGVDAARRAMPTDREVRLRLELSYRRPAWGAVAVRDDALLDLGPHVIDLVRWVTATEVLAVRGARIGTERARFELTLPNAHATIRVATNRPHHELVEVRDLRGRVLARHRLGGLRAAVTTRREGPSSLVVTLAAQLAAFAQVMSGGISPTLGTAADGRAVMETIAAVRASAARGGPAVAVLPARRLRC
jgi:predicted dehydrogenase